MKNGEILTGILLLATIVLLFLAALGLKTPPYHYSVYWDDYYKEPIPMRVNVKTGLVEYQNHHEGWQDEGTFRGGHLEFHIRINEDVRNLVPAPRFPRD